MKTVYRSMLIYRVWVTYRNKRECRILLEWEDVVAWITREFKKIKRHEKFESKIECGLIKYCGKSWKFIVIK